LIFEFLNICALDAFLQVAPISSHALGSSSHPVGDESWLVQQLRGRISQMEKDLVIIHAEVAILKKREN
jgi:hypothetical protein